MPTEKYILEADVKQMVSAQQAIIKNQGRMIQEMKKTGKATKEVGGTMSKVGQEFQRQLKGMVMGFVGVHAAIGVARTLVTKLADDMKKVGRESRTFVQELAPLYSVGEGGPKTIAEIHTLAQAQGIVGRGEIARARTALGAAVEAPTLRRRLLAEAVEMRPLFPTMTAEQVGMGLVQFQRAAGGTAQQAQNVALYLQQYASGEFAELTRYGGRGVGQLRGMGARPERAMAMFGIGTKAPGLTGELVSTGLRTLWIRALERKQPGWGKLGIPGEAGPWAALGALAAGVERGDITDKDLAGMVGTEGLPVAMQLLKNWGAVQRQVPVAQEYIGPGAPDWGAIMAGQYFQEPAARIGRARAQIAERRKAQRWGMREPVGRWEIYGDLRREAWEQMGGGAETLGFVRDALTQAFWPPARVTGGLRELRHWREAGQMIDVGTEPQVPPADAGQRNINLGTDALGEE